ncbi:MAG: prolyl oligopeptidase family serine peptidase [Actinomycetota bacterium]|nr:prolyl oligopeptidase family serine peptidase [Actinomycetota bacterium]
MIEGAAESVEPAEPAGIDDESTAPQDTFPRQHARTQRFTLGAPRNIVVSPDGRRIVFVRSQAGADPINCLWVLDNDTGGERLVADPTQLLAGRDADDLPSEELARRERMREAAGGVTAFATDEEAKVCAFALGGRLFVAGLMSGQARQLDVAGPVFDPRPDPPARRVAYVSGRLLCVGELDGSWRVLAGDDPDEHDTVSWGSAEFIAAEEIGRQRGYWWSPDGSTIAACRVDVAPVGVWTIADPADPAQPSVEQRYPAAGTDNAEVRLFLIPLDGSEFVEVRWDLRAFPYLVDVRWDRRGLLLTVQSRDQRTLAVLRADPATGNTIGVSSDHDEQWVEIVPGTPRWDADGRLVTCADRDGARRLLLDGEPVTPVEQQVRAVVAADEAGVVYLANPVTDATVQHVWRLQPDGSHQALTDEPGVHDASAAGGTIVVRTATIAEPGTFTTTLEGTVIESHAATPLVRPRVEIIRTDNHELATAVLLPSDRNAHDGRSLPVLLDPYGGPHALRVLSAQAAYLTSQWFADQGFVVVVTDGRGTPGRGSEWERAVHGDLATAPLDDQVEGLEAAARWVEQSGAGITCDLGRVAIRGWSFGGYLAALAVLSRPDVFHAAVAGAPVTDWRLYDTHYTERYLGRPDDDAGPYELSSLAGRADQLTRPLLLIHGLADDNVVAAHTLRLSSALLAAGKPHEVLPLVGITHMASQEEVAENLLLHQLDFLRRALALDR